MFAFFLTSFAAVALLGVYFASTDIPASLSPQGCRMSWMSPSYILQSDFNTSWTPLAQRYSLWLYREVGWDPHETYGLPVLFIPGNAGSSHQVRSIASSATRQFYSSPYIKTTEFEGGAYKPLDFFAVEFNEDLSAFHGPTLDSQTAYTARAISYILSLYPPNTNIVVIGHSMGGIVATSLLPSHDISAIITMSTPHALPPARFDARIDRIYNRNAQVLLADPTPILSLCGGATDMMIPSEACILPAVESDAHVPPEQEIYRRTVFTSALEGAWTGVGHREMVWCHQVRWRVARVALELGASRTSILDKWLSDGNRIPPFTPSGNGMILNNPNAYEALPEDIHLVLKEPHGSRTYLLPIPKSSQSQKARFILYVSQGSILSIAPQHPLPLNVSVYSCYRGTHTDGTYPSEICDYLTPTTLKLLPTPVPGETFPVPNEGSDESEGVVLYEAEIPHATEASWVGVRVEGADGRGWVLGGFLPSEGELIHDNVGTMGVLLRSATVIIPPPVTNSVLRTRINFPHVLAHALVAYRVTPKVASSSVCADPLIAPLLMHTSQASETHYFPLRDSRSIVLHSHTPAPYVPHSRSLLDSGINLTIYTSGCDVLSLDITVDWWGTIGRWGTRYPTTLGSWTVGVVFLVLFLAWGESDKGGLPPNVPAAISAFTSKFLLKLLLGSFVVAFIPLPAGYYLGNRGQAVFAPIAPLLILIATGLVNASWWFLAILMWPLKRLGRIGYRRRREETRASRSTFFSIGVIFLLIFLFIPWQVAFMGCWMIHLHTCATSFHGRPFPGFIPTPGVTPTTSIPLIRTPGREDEDSNERDIPDEPERIAHNHVDAHGGNYNDHILFLMTWLLPLVAPVLAVWVRTLLTAGWSTPFDGDHNFMNVASFLVLVDFASWNKGVLLEKQRFEDHFSIRWLFITLAFVAFFLGPRAAYKIFDATNIAVAIIFLARIGRRYWAL